MVQGSVQQAEQRSARISVEIDVLPHEYTTHLPIYSREYAAVVSDGTNSLPPYRVRVASTATQSTLAHASCKVYARLERAINSTSAGGHLLGLHAAATAAAARAQRLTSI